MGLKWINRPRTFKGRGFGKHLIECLKNHYTYTKIPKKKKWKFKDFKHKTKLRYGCVQSPLLFNLTLNKTFNRCWDNMEHYRVRHWRILISQLVYVDNTVVYCYKKERISSRLFGKFSSLNVLHSSFPNSILAATILTASDCNNFTLNCKKANEYIKW